MEEAVNQTRVRDGLTGGRRGARGVVAYNGIGSFTASFPVTKAESRI